MIEMIYCSKCREYFECSEIGGCVCPNHKKEELKILDKAIKELINKGIINDNKDK